MFPFHRCRYPSGKPNWFRRCYRSLCGNVWMIFAGAAFALFLYVLFVRSIWILLILFAMVCGLILWLKN